MYKIYNRKELESRGILGVIDIIINQAHEEGNGEAFKNKYHPNSHHLITTTTTASCKN